MNKKLLLAILMVAVLIIGGLGGAKQSQAVGISPVIYDDIFLNPGEFVRKEMRVFNDTDITDTFYLYAKNFVASGEEGQQVFRDEGFGLQNWISYPTEPITLAPDEEFVFNFTVGVPEDAEPGGHYAALFVTKNPPEEQSSGVGIGSEVGLLVLVGVSGDVVEDSSIKDFEVIKDKSRLNRIPVAFQTRIENKGSIHFKPKGTITIKNIFGMKKAQIDPNPKEGNVLPKSIRKLESQWTAPGMKLESGDFWEEMKWEFRHFAFGRYSAELNLAWSANKPAMTAVATFWIIPWRAGIVILLALILLLFLIKGYNKLVVRSARKKANKKN